jgi:hypothetical protein
MAHAPVALFVAFAWATVGCSASAPPPSPAPVPAFAPVPVPVATFDGKPWGKFHSRRFELSVDLPDGAAWKIDDHRTPWMRAGHEATHSTILVRTWSEDQNVTRRACYARARGWEPMLPDLDETALIDDGMHKLLGEKDTRVAVGVRPPAAPGAMTGGFVVAVAGAIRRCYVVAFQTEAGGSAASDEVAGRLALVEGRLLPSVELDQSFAPSREPLIGSPVVPGGAGGVR